jgi:hypothetical protein
MLNECSDKIKKIEAQVTALTKQLDQLKVQEQKVQPKPKDKVYLITYTFKFPVAAEDESEAWELGCANVAKFVKEEGQNYDPVRMTEITSKNLSKYDVDMELGWWVPYSRNKSTKEVREYLKY